MYRPPRPNPSRIDPTIDPRIDPRIDGGIDGRPVPERLRSSQISMWLVFLVLAAVILAAIAFSVNRSTSVVDTAPTEPAATTTPDATEVVPADSAPDPAPAATDEATTPEATPGKGGTTTTP
ncbi:MAG: hypothetical protein U1E69_17520 [Tabrizicola sp.]|uniref:hypothetical protein n=1 Tax=Tabrizicola sp. TaxID=2005166 RepID=UPI002ABA112D|nr:hypothetical protein [Tabrizicola sp.]MDZ4088592.1 hypothetical protein [Tabrizicola sp.]